MNKRVFLRDAVLIILLLSLGLLLFLISEAVKEDGGYVTVTVNGEWVAEYSLSQNGEYEINGGTNILVIENGSAYVKKASCPDGLCVNQGKISRTGERIVCLPNRVMIEVGGADG